EIGLIALAVAVAAVGAAWYWANRVDRLNRRWEKAAGSLARQLGTRATAVLDLAYSGVLDPASAIVLAESARAALRSFDSGAGPLERAGPPNSELSQAARVALGTREDVEAIGAELVQPLAECWYRVILARRFYNEAVLQTQRLRALRGVRLFRLAGKAPLPASFEMDDQWPPGLGDAPG
ncbi:MAG: hypothetical protein LBT54_02440, partial [Bifidobacteriaceae bacterium]|nr:hypothetical protein [Bifidobacteriaceae bacterium]